MMIENDVFDTIERAVAGHQPNGYLLSVHRDDFRHEGDWWYVVVEPSDPEVLASDYNNVVSRIEIEIERDHNLKVVLVPALVD